MDLLKTLVELGGYWKYKGGRYLAKLTSGKVSDEFVNTGVLTCRPRALAQAVESLIHQPCPDGNEDVDTFAVRYAYKENIYVCGPAMGGVTLAYEVARQLHATAVFTEPVYATKVPEEMRNVDYDTDEFWKSEFYIEKTGQQLKRFEIPEGATILFVEDVITTGKSTYEMVEAVVRHRPNVTEDVTILPYVLCLINRSGKTHVGVGKTAWSSALPTHGLETLSLANTQPRTWDTVLEAQTDLIRMYCSPDAITEDRTMFDAMKGWLRETAGDHTDGTAAMEAVRPKENWDLRPFPARSTSGGASAARENNSPGRSRLMKSAKQQMTGPGPNMKNSKLGS